jgi:hypothetical protein
MEQNEIFRMTAMVAEESALPLPETYTACGKRHREVSSFCSIGTILPSRPARATCRRAQRRSRMARLRATAPAARSVLDGREHDGMLDRVGEPSRPIQQSESAHKRSSKTEITLKSQQAGRVSAMPLNSGKNCCIAHPSVALGPAALSSSAARQRR